MADHYVSRLLTQAAPDDAFTQAPSRVGRYGDGYALNLLDWRQVAADEGGYYVVTNPTPGTGIGQDASVVAFSGTTAFMVLQNSDSPANALGKSAYLDKLTLIPGGGVAVPATTVSMQFAIRKGTTNRRATTAASETENIPVNMRKSTGRSPSLRVFMYNASNPYTVAAAVPSLDFWVARAVIPTGLAVLGDEYVLNFGTDDAEVFQGGAAVRATDVARRGATTSPVVIDPGEFCVIHMWWLTATTNLITLEYQLGWTER